MVTTFAQAAQNQMTRTENGMVTRVTSANKNVDLFGSLGGLRGKNVIPAFVAAYTEDANLAVRIALWGRDIRGGAGERKIFKDILAWLASNDEDRAIAVLHKVEELGRFDDLYVAFDSKSVKVRDTALEIFATAIRNKNGLAAKWAKRKGSEANTLREFMGMTPKQYRKTIVGLSKTVEQDMCARNWEAINYNHVPSVAASRYQKAFNKHDQARYTAYRESLAKGEAGTKVNAGALYPYDIIRGIRSQYNYNMKGNEVNLAQWEALPNLMGDANILPMVDVSGSMTVSVAGSITALDVALSLGLYCADKNKGKFKDMFLTFSTTPELLTLKGNLLQKMQQMDSSKWEMSTNIEAAFKKVLQVAVENKVSQSEMPETIIIFSDMQFNHCGNDTCMGMVMVEKLYRDAGYIVPKLIFWNLNSRGANVPVEHTKNGTALVSGFSPSLMKAILSAEDFTPYGVMMKTISNKRYDF